MVSWAFSQMKHGEPTEFPYLWKGSNVTPRDTFGALKRTSYGVHFDQLLAETIPAILSKRLVMFFGQ
jgi:hypothetical protein